ncbi:unnamed protein product [Gordionus sp. m RMFG-2023]
MDYSSFDDSSLTGIETQPMSSPIMEIQEEGYKTSRSENSVIIKNNFKDTPKKSRRKCKFCDKFYLSTTASNILVKKLHRSPKLMQEYMRISGGTKIPNDVATRWNSRYLMIKSINKNIDAVIEFGTKFLEDFHLNNEESNLMSVSIFNDLRKQAYDYPEPSKEEIDDYIGEPGL